MAGTFADNSAQGRFELTEDGHMAFANYSIADGRMLIPYVEAAMALRGTGAASRLMAHVAGEARARQLKVVPLCGYASSWFRRHPDQRDLLD
ncbi:MAG: N-acetyltransferase [Proteobacteria bacterium]|nr:N-acetyltransferase [Pseudomonadota bacterium]